MRSVEEMNEAIRMRLEEKSRRVVGFIGPLARPIELLDDKVREGRRAWALPSPFLDPLYGRKIVSPFRVPSYLQQYYLGMWEHLVLVRMGCLDGTF